MRLVTFRQNGRDSIGAVIGNQVVALTAAYAAYLQSQGTPSHYSLAEAELPDDMVRFLAAGDRALEASRRAVAFATNGSSANRDGKGPRGEWLIRPLEEMHLLSPVPRPGKVLCIGLNYRDHAEEVNMKLPERPLLFAKYQNSITGPGAPVVLPLITEKVDYEAELTVVIGKTARRVSEADAMEYVAGYTVMNDVSARDIQLGDGQWVRGKTLDTFAPMGPALVTRDEISDPHNLRISLRLNGETMQDSNTSNLLFKIPRLISFLSEGITLEPGDVIATGTPAGVGLNRKPPVFLRPGDTVVVEVEKVGVLENHVVAEQV